MYDGTLNTKNSNAQSKANLTPGCLEKSCGQVSLKVDCKLPGTKRANGELPGKSLQRITDEEFRSRELTHTHTKPRGRWGPTAGTGIHTSLRRCSESPA
eukprot:4233098-Amphidinium_carterae.1